MSHVAHIQTSFAPRANRRCNMCVWERDHRGFVGHKNESRRTYTHVTRAYAPWRAVQQCCVCVCVCERENAECMSRKWTESRCTAQKWSTHEWVTHRIQIHVARMMAFRMNACVYLPHDCSRVLHGFVCLDGFVCLTHEWMCTHTSQYESENTGAMSLTQYENGCARTSIERVLTLVLCLVWYESDNTEFMSLKWVSQAARTCRAYEEVTLNIYTRPSCLCILQRFISFLLCVWERTLLSCSTYTLVARACTPCNESLVFYCAWERER